MRTVPVFCIVLILASAGFTPADCAEPWEEFLNQPILDKDQTVRDTVAFVESRLPPLKLDSTAAEWQVTADKLRSAILERIVYRGLAARWRDAPCRVEWKETVDGGPGYRLRKLRYEALPGLWIPAILYVPNTITGKAPLALNVHGHDPQGKAAGYKQLLCINQVKRGMLVLNVEWLGMGQLRQPGFSHGRMNQLDLCGSSGLAPFYLAMKRGLDILLDLPEGDSSRVVVAGLSGGGWQTIFLSALDTRVTLSNPVAGYSGYRTRLHQWSDLGDSEQTPLDFGTIADYTHLTALLAPRPALLTYNLKDNCCFASGHAVPPLLEAARPAYALFGQADRLAHHVNSDPGNHNFDRDNREALYRQLAEHFSGKGEPWTPREIESADELQTAEQLHVELPEKNANFNSLALDLFREFPAKPTPPEDPLQRSAWQANQRELLSKQVAFRPAKATAQRVREVSGEGWTACAWRLQVGSDWLIPVVEITPEGATETRLICGDEGRQATAATVASLLKEKVRVLAVDPFYFGECKIASRAYLFALMINTVGERPLGVQAGQLIAVAQWARDEWKSPVGLVCQGPRSSCISLVAAALEPDSIRSLQLQQPHDSLSILLTENVSFDAAPELFCAGLLATHDLPLVRQLLAPGVLK